MEEHFILLKYSLLLILISLMFSMYNLSLILIINRVDSIYINNKLLLYDLISILGIPTFLYLYITLK